MTIYFKQLLAGYDFATKNSAAASMENFVYLIGDHQTKECVVIDPAWDVQGLIEIAQADGFKIVGALGTHYHPDHIGGRFLGFQVEGLPTLMTLNPCKVHVHEKEVEGVMKVTGLSKSDLHGHASGDVIQVGQVEIKLLHTPGHTPGSCCFCVSDALIAGDTLFLQGCGRVDLPGGDVDEMYYTLTQRLASLPGDMILFPGHAYGGSSDQLGKVRQNNPYLQTMDLQSWKKLRGF
jgi:hydroxyacylglutathione hydrolase